MRTSYRSRHQVRWVGDRWEDTMDTARTRRMPRTLLEAILASLVLILACCCWPAQAATAEPQMRFGTPEAAVEVLLTAFKNDDNDALSALFGAEYADRLLSKDKVAARADRERLYQAAQKKMTVRKDTADRVVLVLGPDAWPFPIPLARSGTDWRFHTAEGLDEIVNRRIGADELGVIATCRDYLAAQRQYASKIRDTSGVRKFAQRIGAAPARRTACTGIPPWPTARRVPSAR